MKHRCTEDGEELQTKGGRTRDNSMFSTSGLLLSLVFCIALIHVELRIQEHHRLITHSVAFCGQMETQILLKVKQSYAGWQVSTKGSHSEGQQQKTRGEFSFYSRDANWQLSYNLTTFFKIFITNIWNFSVVCTVCLSNQRKNEQVIMNAVQSDSVYLSWALPVLSFVCLFVCFFAALLCF